LFVVTAERDYRQTMFWSRICVFDAKASLGNQKIQLWLLEWILEIVAELQAVLALPQ